jgi:hypothetical protein
MIIFIFVETGFPTPGAFPIDAFNGYITRALRFVPLTVAFSLSSRARREGAFIPGNPLLEDQFRRALTLLLAGRDVAPESAFRGLLVGATGAGDRRPNSASGQELRPRAVVN